MNRCVPTVRKNRSARRGSFANSSRKCSRGANAASALSGDWSPAVARLARSDPTRGSRLRTPCRCAPRRNPAGSSSNSRTLPPPSTTYSAATAARSNSAPSSTASLPPVFAERFQAALAEQVLERLILVRQVRELERDDAAVVDERGAEARAEAEEQHAAAFVAAERLHGRVVQDPDGLAEAPRPSRSRPSPCRGSTALPSPCRGAPGWECRG